MFKGFIGKDGNEYIAKGKIVAGEEEFMIAAKTKKELLIKLAEAKRAAR